MSVRNLKDGSKKPWLCECYPQGRKGKRVRKKFATKGEALAFERYTMKEVDDKPWLGEKVDTRTLSDLVERWWHYHGKNLKSGEEMHRRLEMMVQEMGDPLAINFTGKDFMDWRAGRIRRASGVKYQANSLNLGKPVSANTQNLDLTFLKSVFNFLMKHDEWKLPNPLSSVEPIKDPEKEMAYLTKPEMLELFTFLKGRKYGEELVLIAKMCLSTGCRISEAENITPAQLSPFKFTFFGTGTKAGKNRSIPVSEVLYNDVLTYGESKKPNERIFRNQRQNMENAIARQFPHLPAGQKTHVLRHSFASHFMMDGGDLLVLQRILGHSDIKITMRYAHLAPDHLEQAIRLNPLATLEN